MKNVLTSNLLTSNLTLASKATHFIQSAPCPNAQNAKPALDRVFVPPGVSRSPSGGHPRPLITSSRRGAAPRRNPPHLFCSLLISSSSACKSLSSILSCRLGINVLASSAPSQHRLPADVLAPVTAPYPPPQRSVTYRAAPVQTSPGSSAHSAASPRPRRSPSA